MNKTTPTYKERATESVELLRGRFTDDYYALGVTAGAGIFADAHRNHLGNPEGSLSKHVAHDRMGEGLAEMVVMAYLTAQTRGIALDHRIGQLFDRIKESWTGADGEE